MGIQMSPKQLPSGNWKFEHEELSDARHSHKNTLQFSIFELCGPLQWSIRQRDGTERMTRLIAQLVLKSFY